ncbi:MAG: hypothetical protein H7345_06550 [Rubritepida sp.]|nr:hypothetical protein [Rubritepida sp.]
MRSILLAITLACLLVRIAPALAQDHPVVQQLRSMLPAGNTLTFARATPVAGTPEGVTLENVVLTRGADRTTIATLTLVGLRPDGVTRLELRDLSAPMAGGPPGGPPAGAVTIAGLEVTGLAVRRRPAGQRPQPDDVKLSTLRLENFAGPGRPTFAIARLTVSNWGIGRRTEGEVTGMNFTSIPDNPIDAFSVARVATAGLDIASLATAAMQSRAPGPQPAGRQSVALEGVVMRGGGVVLGGLQSLQVEGEADAQGSGTGRLALRGLTVERAPPTTAFFDTVGLERVDASMSFEGSYDATTGRLLLPAFALGVREVGAIALALGIDGYTPAAAQSNDTSRIRLLNARLRFADEGAYGRTLRAQARATATSEQALREQYASALRNALRSPGPNPAPNLALDGLREVLLRFVRGEINVVELEARPAAPVPFSTLGPALQQGPAPLVRQLGITASGRRQ